MDRASSEAPIRVLFVENHADIIGGGQFSLLGLMAQLDRNRYLPICVCPAEGTLTAVVRQEGIELKISSQPAVKPLNVFKVLVGVFGLYWLLRQQRAGLVHANGSRAMFYAGLAGRLAGAKVVWHVRVPESDGWWDKWLGLLATRVIAISKAVEARFSFIEEAKIQIVYNGVDMEAYKSGQGSDLRRAWGERPWVGMVAQLIPWKHYDDFIAAMAKVATRCNSAGYLAIGAEPDPAAQHEKHLRELVDKTDLGERFRFTGFMRDIPAVMDALDIVVLCSDNEAFGRVLIEAMAAEKPVVATATGGIPEIVLHGETGLLVPTRDIEAISEAVVYLLEHPQEARVMGLAGRQRVEAMFTMQAHARAVEAVFDAMVSI